MTEVKKLSDGAVVECCGKCVHKYHLLPEKGLGHLGYKCEKLDKYVNPDTIHPECKLRDVEVIKDIEQFVCDMYSQTRTDRDIDYLLIVRKGEK